MEVIIGIIFVSMWAVIYAIANVRYHNLKSKHYDALRENIDLRDRNLSLEKKNIVLEAKINAPVKEYKTYLEEAAEIAEEKNDIAKYADFLIKRYEEVYKEKRKLEWQNERLREQVEFFERKLSTEEFDSNALTDLPMDIIEDVQKRAFDLYCSAYIDKNNNKRKQQLHTKKNKEGLSEYE